MEALHDIAGEARGVGQYLDDGVHLATYPAHAPGHDQTDVARADDDNILARHIAFDIDQALRESGGVDAGGSRSRDADIAPVAFPTAHRQDNGPRSQTEHALFC